MTAVNCARSIIERRGLADLSITIKHGAFYKP